MDTNVINHFHSALTQHRDFLMDWLKSDETKKQQQLGGQSDEQVWQVITKIHKALDQIDQGDFGKCQFGDGSVEEDRLELNYTTCVCLAHYSDEQLRTLENELELAAKVQQQLLPSTYPDIPNVNLFVHTKPAHIVSGDYYDFLSLKNEHPAVAVADIMGKGLPASMLMSNLQATLRIIAREYEHPDALLQRLNELFLYNLKLIRFISIFVMEIDPVNRKIFYSNAGHNPPLFWQNDKQSINFLNPTGPAIGLSPAPAYQKQSMDVGEGDILFIYTDGLIEARNNEQEEFGEDRLKDFIFSHHNDDPKDIIKNIFNELGSFAPRVYDDITAMAIRFE